MECLPGELIAMIWGLAGLSPRGPTRAMHTAIRVEWFALYVQQLLSAQEWWGMHHLLQFAVLHDESDLLAQLLDDKQLCPVREWLFFSMARALCVRGHVESLRVLLMARGATTLRSGKYPEDGLRWDILPAEMAEAELAMCTRHFGLEYVEYCVIGCTRHRQDHAIMNMLQSTEGSGVLFARPELFQTITTGNEQWVDFVLQYLRDTAIADRGDAEYAFLSACTSGNVSLCRRFVPGGELPIPDYRTCIDEDGWMSPTHMAIVHAGHMHLINEEFGFPGGGTTAPFFKVFLGSENVAKRAKEFRRVTKSWDIRPGMLTSDDMYFCEHEIEWFSDNGEHDMVALIKDVVARGLQR